MKARFDIPEGSWDIGSRPSQEPTKDHPDEHSITCYGCGWTGPWTKWLGKAFNDLEEHQREHLPTRYDVLSQMTCCPKPCCTWECVKCGQKWRSHPDQPTCQQCGSLYVKWANYTTWRKKHPIRE